MIDFGKLRETSVQSQIASRGVRDSRVLAAMRAVPREFFVSEALRKRAYEDAPLPIGSGQTISQPYVVALMIEAMRLRGGEKVLEIGSGSGYAAAVLAQIADEVFAIERVEELAALSVENLERAGCRNVHVRHGDGTEGWREEAPFDAILVSAGGPEVPRPLMQQLAIGGRMVVPVGARPGSQRLIRVTRTDEGAFEREELASVRFVPLIGKEGWDGSKERRGRKPLRSE